jgi:hypothetical protein
VSSGGLVFGAKKIDEGSGGGGGGVIFGTENRIFCFLLFLYLLTPEMRVLFLITFLIKLKT